jgi:hypothetical protein
MGSTFITASMLVEISSTVRSLSIGPDLPMRDAILQKGPWVVHETTHNPDIMRCARMFCTEVPRLFIRQPTILKQRVAFYK